MRIPRFTLAVALAALASGATAQSDADKALARALGLDPPKGRELAAMQAEAAKHPLGSPENPVLADMPKGERAYLDRLRCTDGSPPAYSRAGDMGPGAYGSVVDLYNLTCSDGTKADVVIDMYHRHHVEKAAVPGFTIVAP